MSVQSIITRLEGDFNSVKRELKHVEGDIKATTAEFGAMSAAVSKTNATFEQLENKNKSAEKAVEAYQKKLEQLKIVQNAVSEQKGPDSYEYRSMEADINRTTKALNSYKSEIEQTTAQMEELSRQKALSQANQEIQSAESNFKAVSSAVSKTNATVEQLAEKNKAATRAAESYNSKIEQLKKLQDQIAKQKGIDSDEYREIAQEIDKATTSLNGYKNEVEQTTAQMEKLGTKSALTWDKVSSGLKKMRNTGAVMSATVSAPLVMFGKEAVQSYVDAQETEDLFRVSMGSNASVAESFVNEKASQMPQIDPLKMKENVAVMYEMTHAMGATSGESLEMSQNLAMLAEDLGSLKNVDASEAFDKLRSAMSGESEPLKAWGYIINDTNVKQWALTNGLIEQGEELDDAQKAWARYNLILEKTKTAQGNLLETGDSPANQIKATKAELAQASRELGEKLLPILSDLLGVANGVVDAWNSLSDSQQENIIKMGLFVAAAGPVMTTLGQLGTTITGIASKLSKAAKEAGGFKEALSSFAGSKGGKAGLVIGGTLLTFAAANQIYSTAMRHVDSVNQNIIDEIDARTAKQVNKINALYDPQISAENELLKATREASQDKIEVDKKYYDDKIAEASYAEQKARKAIQTETEAYKAGYQERIKLIEAEYDAKIKAIEDEEKAKLASLQAKIDEVDKQIAAEEKAEKEKTDKITEQQLKQNVAAAKTVEQRKQAQNELDDFYKEKEKERIAEEREALKESLRNQMDKVQEESSAKVEALNAELAKDKEIEQLKLDNFNEQQEKRLEALDGYSEREVERLTSLRDNAIRIEQERTAQVTAEIQKRIDKYNEEKAAAIAAENEKAKVEKETNTYEGVEYYWRFFMTDEQKEKLNKVKEEKASAVESNYTGDNNWRGGLTRVHDRFGGEIINLPSGSQILPHDISTIIAETAGKSLSSSGGTMTATMPINVYIGGERIYSNIARAQLKDQIARKRGTGA